MPHQIDHQRRCSNGHTETLDLRVQNLDCEHDAHTLERALEDVAGVESLRVLPKAARVTVSFDPSVTSPAGLRRHLEESGFLARVDGNYSSDVREIPRSNKRDLQFLRQNLRHRCCPWNSWTSHVTTFQES